MDNIYFKQSDQYDYDDHIPMFSFDRIAHTVTQAIYYKLIDEGWTPAAAVQFLQSKAIRHGLDQTLGIALEQAAEQWTLSEAEAWRNDCDSWAWSKQHNETTGA